MVPCLSFAPVADVEATVLVLGSMPGHESLLRQEYYAFRHNAFWRITGEIFVFDPALPYMERLAALRHCHLALWDVLSGCQRMGSLDAMIRNPVPNDLKGLLQNCPKITKICCNGATAGKYLQKFFPDLPQQVIILPSTSPAAAIYSYEEKLRRWREVLTI